MKTTIDLPDDLVRQLKLRALTDRRKLKDLAAELLRNGLSRRPQTRAPREPVVVKNKKTGLPMIQVPRSPSKKPQPTPDQIAQFLLDQEVHWALESS